MTTSWEHIVENCLFVFDFSNIKCCGVIWGFSQIEALPWRLEGETPRSVLVVVYSSIIAYVNIGKQRACVTSIGCQSA